jgi:hypothetical protein
MDFADVKEVDDAMLEQWKDTNKILFSRIMTELSKDALQKPNHMSYRAALHAWCGRGFADETDDRCQKLWSTDTLAFPVAMGWSSSATRALMNNTYERDFSGFKLSRDMIAPPVKKGRRVPQYIGKRKPGRYYSFANFKSDLQKDKWLEPNRDLLEGQDQANIHVQTLAALMHRTYKR